MTRFWCLFQLLISGTTLQYTGAKAAGFGNWHSQTWLCSLLLSPPVLQLGVKRCRQLHPGRRVHLPKAYHSNSILNFLAADFGSRGITGRNKSATALVPQAPGLRNTSGDRCVHPLFSTIRKNIERVSVSATFLCLPCFCSRCKQIERIRLHVSITLHRREQNCMAS